MYTKRFFLFVAVIILVSVACTSTTSEERADDPNFKDGLFINNHIDHPNKSFFSFMRMRLFGDEVWADHKLQADLIPQTEANISLIKRNAVSQVTWLGHSTFLVQHNGVNILTDPMFSDRASPVSFAGPKRYTRVALQADQLPDIDIVIISHNHYDHLDEASIKALGSAPTYYVPSGLKAWFVDQGIQENRVVELKWWQSATIAEGGHQITAMPSQHWSARGLTDKNESHWASWYFDLGDLTLWFAGDTGYNDRDFIDIGQYIASRGKALDLALIPIGAYGPRSFMKTYHVNTEEAVQIHHDTKAKLSLGMHWGAFPLTSEWPVEPLLWLDKIREEGGIAPKTSFETLKIGETRSL